MLHLEIAAPLTQFPVHRLHQIAGDVTGHLLGGGGDAGRSLLEGGQQVGPEAHQVALVLGHQPLALEMGGAALAVPEGLAMLPGMLALGQTGGEGPGAGVAIGQPQAGGLQDPAGVHR